VVWARITSAAKTIQGIGRGARSYTDTRGRKKKHCLVFETNWILKKNAKRGRRPLRLADALAQNGEDPEAICSMANGKPLAVDRAFTLGEDGRVDIGGRVAVGIRSYVNAVSSNIGYDALKHSVTKAGLNPVPNVRVFSGTYPVEVYWKDEVDALLPQRLDEHG